jgi:ComEC/Rec2-related protein
VVRWWAAFFIAGLVAPPNVGLQCAASILLAGSVLGILARERRHASMGFDGAARRRFARALSSVAITGSAAIIVWGAAGLQRNAHDRAQPGTAIEASNWGHIGARSETGHLAGSRSGAVSRFRALSLMGAKSRLLEALNDGRLSKRARGLVGALVLDDRRGLDFVLSEAYSYVGITHFLALSGLHLAAIAIPLSKILSRLIRSKRLSDVALLAILWLYSAVAGFPASLLRALFLSAAVSGYRFVGMHTDLIGALIAGSFTLVAIDPAIAFDAGFQLSFGAVCGIAFIGIPLSRIVEPLLPGGVAGKVAKALLYPALITCSVQFFTMPVTVSLFKRSSLLSPLVNVIVSFPFTVLLYAGVLYVFVPVAPVRAILSRPVDLLCRFLGAVPAVFSEGPHAAIYRGSFMMEAYLAGVGLLAWSLRRSCARKRPVLGVGVACLVIAFLVPLLPWYEDHLSPAHRGARGTAGAQAMTFPGGIYVPEGGGIILIEEAFDSREAYRLTRALWERGVNRIRYCVVKPSRLRRHHGVHYLLARISVEEVICSPYLLADPGSAEPLGARCRVVRAVSRGDSLENGSWRLEILAPVYPPSEGAVVSRADAGISCRLEIKYAAGRTTLDLKHASGYHAVP